ncbi:glycosyltransferase family A protein [uncultured Eubacterium sp.]|uniref:glycosyltransferase family 2 protein n=1 Tax=uncultured Eubacterium sp. TaxID=165185 RepID=UPI00259A49EB|nr:glycosyltransferase family A protein [uncultured Eubacterium sp.]
MEQFNDIVSIVVATYRRDKTLICAIKSLINQTYRNIEIIIVDDNNDDEWNDIVKQIVESFKVPDGKTIKLIVNKQNMGSAKTRNIGIDAAVGEYVTFLDDDDIYLPNKVETQIRLMVNKKADYSITDLTLLNEDNSISENRRRNYLNTKEGDNLMVCHMKYHMTGTDTMMFRRSYLNEIGKFEAIDVGDEFYLMVKAIEKNGKFAYLPESYVKAYVHTGEGGLSSGETKIEGENDLYNYKREKYVAFSRKDRKYIDMRHHAVLAFAYKRNGKIVRFILEGLYSFVLSPSAAIKLLYDIKTT